MAQSMSVKLSRTDASPWGFRLQGGKDFGAPLLIQKVNGGSPAERAGLQAGDAVIKVNNTEVFNLRHKDAQDNIVRAGNSFEITVQRGGSTWKPAVIPVGPQPVKPQVIGNVTPVTKTSLAANKQPASPIGTGHNYTPVPFGQPQMNGSNGVDPVKSIVNKQYNSPVGIYSEETIAETLSAQAEVLAGGVLGVNFKKNEKNYDPANSEVFKMLNEIANEPEPEAPPAAAFERVAPAPAPAAVPFSVAGLRHVTAPEPRPPVADDQKTVLPPGQNICGECERLVVGVFVRIKDKNLHVECFKCATCGTSLKNVGYYNINNKLYCDVHAKLVARQHPPAPNLEPVTVPPGGSKPAGAISAALANRGPAQPPPMFNRAPAPAQPPSMFNRAPAPPAPAQPASAFNRAPAGPAPGSPQPSNFGPVPFHAPGGFSGVRPTFNASAPAPAPMPASPVAAPFASSPSMTPAKPATVSGKFVWPPKTPTEEICSLPTATPLYIPPGPSKAEANISVHDPSAVADSEIQQQTLSRSLPESKIQPFPEPYAEFVTHHPIARPMSAYHYQPKPLGTNEERPKSALAAPVSSSSEQHKVAFDGDVQFIETDELTSMINFEEANMNAQRKKFSVCSQEVMDFNEHNVVSSSVEHLSDSIDTAILVSSLSGRPESPVPMDHVNQHISMLEDVSTTQNTMLKKHSVNTTTSEFQESSVNVEYSVEKELVNGLKNVIETQGGTTEQARKQSMAIEQATNPKAVYELDPILPQQCKSPFIDALTTASDRPYSPFPTASDVPPPPSLSPRPTTLPVSYRQLPEPKEGFKPITQAEEKSSFVNALTIAPKVAVCPLPPPMEPLPTKPIPFPEQTAPYHTLERSEACPSPMISALTIAPDRPYSPLLVTQAPTSVIDTIVPETKTSIDVGEPFNLPTPSHYSSMLAALTIAPERPYSPLNVTQAPTSSTSSGPTVVKPESSSNMMPQRIVGDIQAAVFKPTAETVPAQSVPPKPAVIAPEPKQAVTAESSKQKQVVKSNQVKTAQVAETKKTQKVVQKTQETAKKVAIKGNVVKKSGSEQITKTQKTSQVTNALNIQRQTQQRPITPKIPRPTTPSAIRGLAKPSAIPYYQQNIADGDFACRSPRPTTPNLSCPMTASRPQTPGIKGETRPITPIPHKQLQKVRSLTPVVKAPETSGTPGHSQHQSHQSVTQRVLNTMASSQGAQVVVTKKTHVTEEFESFHKESTQVIEKSGTSQKCILQTENKSALAEQSVLDNKEVTSILNGSTTQSKTSSFEASQYAEQSQKVSSDSQYNIQTLEMQQQMTALPVQSIQKEGFMSLAESQRDSPLPFPNISLPEGMKYEVVDNKALYSTTSQKQMFKINYPNQAAQSSQSASQFQVQAPTNKQPFSHVTAPKFQPKHTMLPYIPSAPTPPQMSPAFVPQQSLGQVKFQPLAPQPILSTANQIQAPTATLPVNITNSQQFNGNIPQSMPSIPIMSTGVNNFTPKSSGNGFQNFAPKSAAVEPASFNARKSSLDVVSRRFSSDVASKNVVPSPSFVPVPSAPQGTPPRRESQGILKHTQDVVPKTVAPGIRVPGLMDPCTSPPNAGGGAGGKGAFAGSSAPVRGRGVLNQPGARQAVCGQCHGQIRGPFVTALGKIWCPEHFICVNPQCKRQLADIGFVEEKGQLYCEYCFEQFIAPPCSKCSGKIKGDCLNAIGKTFHPECFCCCYCGKLFGNNPFFLEDGMPYCQADWNELFTTKCFACGFPIEAGDRWVEALNNNYHSQCFNCTSCKKNLEGQSFFAKSGRPFCKAHAR